MEGKIIEQDDDWIGVSVVDNASVEHKIAVGFDREIHGHGQDGYPDDPSERTPVENEHVAQARRYGKHTVYEERGEAVLSWDEDLPKLAALEETLQALSSTAFERYFGDYYEAVSASAEGGSVTSMIETLERGIDIVYVDLYLGQDGQIERVSEPKRLPMSDDWENIADPPEETAHLPDVRIDMLPLPFPTIQHFRLALTYQVKCQIRDYYLGSGQEPPEEYRILGPGKYKFWLKYSNDQITVYEDYGQPTADIPGYDFGLGLDTELEAEMKDIFKSLQSSP